MTRDVGTQSTPPDLSSGSLSPASTPSILERALKRCGTENGDSPNSNTKSKTEEQVCFISMEVIVFLSAAVKLGYYLSKKLKHEKCFFFLRNIS